MDHDLLAVNKDLADKLSLIAGYYTLARDTYRAKSFTTASQQIGQHSTPITSGKQAKKDIKGVGTSTADIIDEYLQTGTIKRLETLQQQFIDQRKTIDWLLSFYGIGPVKALELYNSNIRTLEDLWHKGNLTDAQKIGFMWRDHIPLKISRSEMELINAKISSILDPYQLKWTIAGSYRREEPTSGDIDLLVEARPDLSMDGLVYLLQSILPASLASGPKKYMGIIRIDDQHNGHRIDIRIIEPESYAYGLMYFTGSQRFNILMRQRAIDLGLILNEYGIYKQQDNAEDVFYPAPEEKNIFEILRVQYLSPAERTRTLPSLTFY